jgi:hypothetical protein
MLIDVNNKKIGMKESMKSKLFLAIILGLSTLSAVAANNQAIELVPSVWAVWMRGSMAVDGQEAKINRDSEDYFGDLDYGGSAELVLRNNKTVLLGSFDYFDSISSDVTVSGQAGTLESSEIKGCIAIGYPLSMGKSTVDVLAGLQTLRLDNELKLTAGPSYSDSANIYDVVLMLRIKQELFSKLYLNIPLSIGGAYLSDSDFVYDAGVQLLFQFSDKFDVRAGYRIAGYDFSEDAVTTDFYQQGYTLGLGITF